MFQFLSLLILQFLPLFSLSSNLRTAQIHLTRSQLEKVGCHTECANKAIKLIHDRIDMNVLLTKFVREVIHTLHVPRDEARLRTNLARDDLLGYLGNVWKAIAIGDVESAVTQQTSILDKLEFEKRLDGMMNTTMEKGPNFVEPRGLIGGPVPNYRCASGASLAGAMMPNGHNICIPLKGNLNNLPIKCSRFGMVPNSVLKTLGDKDFKEMCEKNSDCEYIRFVDDEQPGLCLAKSNHMDMHGLPIVDDDQKIDIVGGIITDEDCESGYARAGTFNPKRGKPHCVDKNDVKKPLLTQDAANTLSDQLKNKKVFSKIKNTEERTVCTRRHQARLFGVGQLSTMIRVKRVDCDALSTLSSKSEVNNTPKSDVATTTTNGSDNDKKCCDEPTELTNNERKLNKCKKELISMIQRKEAMDQDISSCTLMLHNSQCDTISPERKCGKKPWCTSKQVDLLVRVADHTLKDCCNSYKCISKGFGDGREKMVVPPPLKHTTAACPDFSSVSPLKSLQASGVGEEGLAVAYKAACTAVKGCVYIEESNTCV
jgi:hypothetical protein